MRIVRIFLFIAVVATLFSGCRSRKNASSAGVSRGQWEQAGGIALSGEISDDMGRDLAEAARGWLGTPYRYGGADRNGTDCSGLVMALYQSVCATKLPRTTVEQKSYCTTVARNKARIGDLMFFGSGKSGGQVSHVGLYIGEGEMIHASSSRGVMVSKVDTGYWGDRFRSVGRVDGAYAAWANTPRGTKALKGKKNKDVKKNIPQEDVPSVVLPGNIVPPVPVGEIAYDKLPLSTGGVEPGNDASARMEAQQGAAVEPAAAVENSDAAAASIDLLDLIINQKVDSIFSNRFMD